MASQGGDGIRDDRHCLGESMEMGRFGEQEPLRRATVLTGLLLDLEFSVHGQLGHGVPHDASVSARLLQGQTWESDACL